MINFTRFFTDYIHYGDDLRYTPEVQGAVHGVSRGRGPVVAWNITRRCNLYCRHCYSNSSGQTFAGELTTAEALDLIDQLADFKVPVLLFSGGEPLMRPDVFTLLERAGVRGMRPTLSTNGTLINRDMALRLKDLGVGYVGISLDGTEELHDRFRGKEGAYRQTLAGIRNCVAAGQRVGLRFTINRRNYQDIEAVFDLMEAEGIDRICFYHLVYSGRGSALIEEDVTAAERRAILDIIIARTEDFARRGLNKEILTVDNHADGVYLYQRLLVKNPQQAEKVRQLLALGGGNRSGMAFANVDSLGNVHPDQFTAQYSLGNVKERPFGEIWSQNDHPILEGLKHRQPLLGGRCAKCRYLYLCNGNFRARAEAVYGDFWASDPACYLTDEEIGIA